MNCFDMFQNAENRIFLVWYGLSDTIVYQAFKICFMVKKRWIYGKIILAVLITKFWFCKNIFSRISVFLLLSLLCHEILFFRIIWTVNIVYFVLSFDNSMSVLHLSDCLKYCIVGTEENFFTFHLMVVLPIGHSPSKFSVLNILVYTFNRYSGIKTISLRPLSQWLKNFVVALI